MSRYIDADWIIQKLERWRGQLAETYGENDEYVLCLGEVLMKLDDAPTADVRENVRGNLVNIEPSITVIDVIDTPSGGALLSMDKACSKCKTPIPPNLCDDVWFKYCPFCGADIRRES